MSITSAGLHEANIVVFKNLALETTVSEIENSLKAIHMVSTGIDRKVDSAGNFRGTVFIRFATPEVAMMCVEKLEPNSPTFHGRKARVELLRTTTRGRSFSAKEALEAGSSLETRLTSVRELITNFVNSNKLDTHLPKGLDAEQRKLAHSLAEKFGLSHKTILPDDPSDTNRSVFLSKSRSGSFHENSSSQRRSMAALVTASAVNEVAKISQFLPHVHTEVPVYGVSSVHNLDQVAMMHAAQAQAHADAAREALKGAKLGKERDAMPAWLEIVHKPKRTMSNLNASAPEFIPSASYIRTEGLLPPPPGLRLIN